MTGEGGGEEREGGEGLLRVGEVGSLRGGGETGLLRGPSAFELLIMLAGLVGVSENLHDEEGVEEQ